MSAATSLALLAQALFPSSFVGVGMGNVSCARAFEPQHVVSTHEWIGGFLTGANSRDGGRAGKGSDLSGIVAEVKLICDREPSRQLGDATMAAYTLLRLRTRP